MIAVVIPPLKDTRQFSKGSLVNNLVRFIEIIRITHHLGLIEIGTIKTDPHRETQVFLVDSHLVDPHIRAVRIGNPIQVVQICLNNRIDLEALRHMLGLHSPFKI